MMEHVHISGLHTTFRADFLLHLAGDLLVRAGDETRFGLGAFCSVLEDVASLWAKGEPPRLLLLAPPKRGEESLLNSGEDSRRMDEEVVS